MKIVVLGGGTAGLFSALMFRHYADVEDQVVVIDSTKIGRLGPGEGGTPILNQALELMGIDENEFMESSSSTYKNGILFEGWSEKNPSFFHGFTPLKLRADQKMSASMIAHAIAEHGNLNEINIAYDFVKDNSVDLTSKNYAFHFDANQLAEFLKLQAKKAGVEFIDNVVTDIIDDPDTGNVRKLVFEDGSDVELDFLVDASGFKRLVVGGHYKVPWNDVSDTLPCKRAIAFNINSENNGARESYTTAIAMSNGWAWKIPLRHRWGAGYVFDPSSISDEDALDEIYKKFGHEVQIVNKFNFEPGYLDRVWVNNVLAVGISASFFEPLEATSINQSLLTLYAFLEQPYFKQYKSGVTGRSLDNFLRSKFNSYIKYTSESFNGFLALHYRTDRKDTNFWSKFSENFREPELLKTFLSSMRTSMSSKSIEPPLELSESPNVPELIEVARRSKRLLSSDNWVTIHAGMGGIDYYEKFLSPDGKKTYEDSVKIKNEEFNLRNKKSAT